jgi:hypothetical protein
MTATFKASSVLPKPPRLVSKVTDTVKEDSAIGVAKITSRTAISGRLEK